MAQIFRCHLPNTERCVMLASRLVYIPPQGSHRLQQLSQMERYARLASDVGLVESMGHVLLCGDFNAHVSSDGLIGVSVSGCALLDFCNACNLTLLTGQLAGDQPAAPSFAAQAHATSSRPDHVVVSECLMHCMQTSCVHADRADFDHFSLRLKLTSSKPTQPSAMPSNGDTCKRIKRDKHCLIAYQAELVGSGCMRDMQSAMHSRDMRDGAHAASKLSEALLLNIANAAGMRMSNAHSGAKRALSRQKPW